MQILYCPECKSEIHPEQGILHGNESSCDSCANRLNGDDLICLDTDKDTYFFPDSSVKFRFKWFPELFATPERIAEENKKYAYYCPNCKSIIHPESGSLKSTHHDCDSCVNRQDGNDLVIWDNEKNDLFFPESAEEFKNRWKDTHKEWIRRRAHRLAQKKSMISYYCPECKTELDPSNNVIKSNLINCLACAKRQDASDLVIWDNDNNILTIPESAKKHRLKWSQEIRLTEPARLRIDQPEQIFYCPDCKSIIHPEQNQLQGDNSKCDTCANRKDTSDLVIKDIAKNRFTIPNCAMKFRPRWYPELRSQTPTQEENDQGYLNVCSLHEVKLNMGSQWKSIDPAGVNGILKIDSTFALNFYFFLCFIPSTILAFIGIFFCMSQRTIAGVLKE